MFKQVMVVHERMPCAGQDMRSVGCSRVNGLGTWTGTQRGFQLQGERESLFLVHGAISEVLHTEGDRRQETNSSIHVVWWKLASRPEF